MAQGTQAHKQKKCVLLMVPEECVARKVGTLPPAQRRPGLQATRTRRRKEGWKRARAGSHAARRRGAHAQSGTSPGGEGDPALGGGGRSARAAAPDESGLRGCCSAQHRGPAEARSSMCRGSPAAAAAPLQQRRQQQPPWPSPARSSPASCKVRSCGGLRDAPPWSIPDPVHSSPRHTPALVPPAPAPTHPGCKAAPCPCIPARSISVPGASSAAHLASPCQVLLAPEPPVPIFGEGAVPSRSLADSQRPWPTPQLGVQFPLRRIPVSPPGGARPAPPHDGSCPWS